MKRGFKYLSMNKKYAIVYVLEFVYEEEEGIVLIGLE